MLRGARTEGAGYRMAGRDRRVVDALIESQGLLFSEQMGAEIAIDTPQELFHWLVGTILLAARIDAGLAVQAGRALRTANLYKIDTLLGAERHEVIAVLRDNGYARYDTVTTDHIRAAAELVRDRHDGDLRALRDLEAGGILAAVQEVKGIGEVGAGIFAREVQLVWDPLYPRADGPALDAAAELELPREVGTLVDLAGSRERFVRLMAGLTRAALDAPSAAVREAAAA